ncbi:MAG: hypothetical protein V1802_01170 [Candidatus Aenigmatarchaeota archaeon]
MQNEQYNVLLAIVKLIEEKKPSTTSDVIREAMEIFKSDLTDSQKVELSRQFFSKI